MPEFSPERRERPRIIVLDERFNVILADARSGDALDAFRNSARDLVERNVECEEIEVAGIRYVVRVTRLAGVEGHRYAMLIEMRGTRRPLMDAYDRFGLSPREVEVLALIIDGASNREIAETLSIVESTVQDHIRSLGAKVGVNGRGALLARVFGIEGEPSPGNAPPE